MKGRAARAFWLFLAFAAVGAFCLRGVLLAPGFLLNGDWIPYWRSEVAGPHAAQWLEKWSDVMGVLGGPFVHQNEWPHALIVALAGFLGIPGPVYQRLFILFLFGLCGASAYAFVRRRGCGPWAALAAGLFAVANPVFFDFLEMGWIYVLLAMGILPFALDLYVRSVREGDLARSAGVGVLWAIAFCQSQVIVWYPLAFLAATPAAIARPRDLLRAARALAVAGLVFAGLHAFWVLPLLASPDRLVTRPVSVYDVVRFGLRLNEVNLIRLWGSVFNMQFESATQRAQAWLGFVPAGLAFGALLVRRRPRWTASLAILALMPFVFWTFRLQFLHVPFSTVIRDVSRFLALSAVAYAVLIGFAVDGLLRRGRPQRPSARRVAGCLALVAIVLQAGPFWAGRLYRPRRKVRGWSVYGFDQRLRPLVFPEAFARAERALAPQAKRRKGLWLPTGGALSMTRDPRFMGPYAECQDIVALYSRTGRQILLSDKSTGPERAFHAALLEAATGAGGIPFAPLARWAGIGHLLVRRGFAAYGGVSGDVIAKRLLREPGIELVHDDGDLVVFRVVDAPERLWGAPPVFAYGAPFGPDLGRLLPFADPAWGVVFVGEQAGRGAR